MTRKQKLWFYGLGSGFLGGMWTSIDSGLVVLIAAPDEFNFGDKTIKTLTTIAILGVLAGTKVAVAFMKQSPLPPLEGETEFIKNKNDTTMKIILAITALLVFAYFKTHAAEPPSLPAATAALAASPLLFHAEEWQIDLNGTVKDSDPYRDTDNLSYGGGLGINYFPWRSTGFGIEGSTEDTSSAFFDRIGVSLIGRMPIEKLRLAPEFKVGYDYDFEKGGSHATKDPNGHEVFASIGAELRLTRSVGFGVECRGVKPLDGSREYLLGLARVRFNF